MSVERIYLAETQYLFFHILSTIKISVISIVPFCFLNPLNHSNSSYLLETNLLFNMEHLLFQQDLTENEGLPLCKLIPLVVS